MSEIEQIAPWLNGIGVPGLLAAGLYALYKGWIITGREYQRASDECQRLRKEEQDRYAVLKAERDEWKAAALRNLTVAEKAVDTATKTAEHITKRGGH